MSEISVKQDWITGEKNKKLFHKTWEPKSKTIATLVFCHGLGEHIGRSGYEELFAKFASEGIKVGSWDGRGFGETCGISGSSRGEFEKELYLSDIKLISNLTRIDGIPHFIAGQSMGGFYAIYYSSLHQEEFSGCIGMSPLISASIKPTFVERMILKYIARWIPSLKWPVNLDARLLSHNVDVVKDYTQDPLVHNLGTFGLLRFLYYTPLTLITEHAPTYRLPVLICHGTSDQITSPEYSESFIDACSSLDKKFEGFVGGYHELHNEIDEFKIPVTKSYIKWIKSHSK